MPKTRREALALVHEFRQRLAAFYGSRLKEVYLYGSYARGEADDDSDIDIAIVLEGPVDRAEERWRTNDIASELSLREDCLLNTVFLSEDEIRRRPYPIARSISREGVAV